ncbi:MAG: prepilin-type N-terminal cleavage/methylation domain-containing protein [Candidatus Firestonebacteria bacterium]|nr:prepilin-type N-terminal cleavage/methylation domain-containing protein [Candidatus Firestonebacteria bacterium]
MNIKLTEFKSEKGLTLIEILVTSAIVSIVIFIIYMVFYSITQAIEQNKYRTELYQEARVILNRMEREISSSFFSDKNALLRLKGEDGSYIEYDNDRIDFVCTLNPLKKDTKQSDLMEIGYYLKYGENTESGTLVRRYSGMVDEFTDKGGDEGLLAQEVRGVNFRYFDGKDWLDIWDTNNKGKLPNLIEITITFYDSINKKEYPITTIASLPQAEIYK